MIRFFRTLRQRLLSESRFSKYLLYALGEILLVVVGILIALQVNTWNDVRKERIEVRRLMSDLQDEVAVAIKDRDSIIRRAEEITRQISSVLDILFSESAVELSDEECTSILRSHSGMRWAPYNPSTLDELVATGKISIITNLPLRKALLDFRNLTAKNKEYVNTIIASINVLVDKYPTLIVRNWNPETQQSDFVCQIEAMRGDSFFLTQLQSNLGRWGAPLSAATAELKALEQIREYLQGTQ